MSQQPPEQQGPAQPPLPPPYQQPPPYGQPLGYPTQQAAYPAQQLMPQGPAPDSRNVLGILSLVAPFVGFSAVGIVLGHLGLNAVKKGTANNRGVALAGTIVSWAFTIVFVLLIAASIAIPIFLVQQAAPHDAAVKADLAYIRVAVATHYVDSALPPEFSFDGSNYRVGDQVIPADASVIDARLVSTGPGAYCIEASLDNRQVRSLDQNGYFDTGCP